LTLIIDKWGGEYKGYLGDTYTEIENGIGADYFCHNDQKLDKPVGFTNIDSCLYFHTWLSPLNMVTVLRDGGQCSTSIPQALVFVCDP